MSRNIELNPAVSPILHSHFIIRTIIKPCFEVNIQTLHGVQTD